MCGNRPLADRVGRSRAESPPNLFLCTSKCETSTMPGSNHHSENLACAVIELRRLFAIFRVVNYNSPLRTLDHSFVGFKKRRKQSIRLRFFFVRV